MHQPSGDIGRLIDHVMLISGGRLCYYGPFAGAESCFTQLGYACARCMQLRRPPARATAACPRS